MDMKDLERSQCLGVIGSGLIAAAIAAMATMPWPAQGQSPTVIKFSHVVAVDTPKGKGGDKLKELAEKRLPSATSR